jgi:hypothetical protein
MTAYIIAFVAGILLSGLWIGAARRYPVWEKEIFGYTLVLAGVIYVFFGLIEGRAIGTMMPEALVGLGFIILATLGLRGSLLALGIGWALHGTWDYAAPMLLDVSYVPWFLEPSCIGYDFIVGVYLILRSRGKFAP